MRLPDGFALVVAAVVDVVDPVAGVVELATPLLFEHPARSTTAMAPTPAAAHAFRFTSVITDPTPLSVVLALV
jgi:hypothetical protein